MTPVTSAPTPNASFEDSSEISNQSKVPSLQEPQDVESSNSRKRKESPWERLERLKSRRIDAEEANKLDLYSETSKKSLTPAAEQRAERKLKKAMESQRKREAAQAGEDASRQAWSTYSIEDVERWNEKQAIKQGRVNDGFSDYNQLAAKKYTKLVQRLEKKVPVQLPKGTKALLPEAPSEFKEEDELKERYEEQKSRMEKSDKPDKEEGFYRDLNSLTYADQHKPHYSRVNRMAQDVTEQIQIRHKASRRRAYDPDEDVTYINERNRQFNRKIARAYDKYTQEIRDNLERGTAL